MPARRAASSIATAHSAGLWIRMHRFVFVELKLLERDKYLNLRQANALSYSPSLRSSATIFRYSSLCEKPLTTSGNRWPICPTSSR